MAKRNLGFLVELWEEDFGNHRTKDTSHHLIGNYFALGESAEKVKARLQRRINKEKENPEKYSVKVRLIKKCRGDAYYLGRGKLQT